jgi:NitT/TauT family transport system substrate-binding protein
MKLYRTLAVTFPALIAALLTASYFLESAPPGRAAAFKVGFLPVTCHLTCPVTHFINEQMTGDGLIVPQRFNEFPTLTEAFLSKNLQATFILAPLAMRLRDQQKPVKIVYLGHRDGTTMMVHRDSDIHAIEDLKGKRVAIPSKYSNQHLILVRAFAKRGLSIKDVNLVEMPPPDMPVALSTRSVDAVIAGEPLMAKTEMEGFGRVLFMTKDEWPNFISCVLAVREDVIRDRRPEVQQLVDGIARSGLWIDEDKDTTMSHRLRLPEFVSKQYYNQDPKLLEYVLSKPPDRVKYTNLKVRRADFEEIEKYARMAGLFDGNVSFDDYTDTSFVPEDRADLTPYRWEPGR